MISKTRIKQNDQCEKQFWLDINRPKLKIYKPETLKAFQFGRKFESVAHQDYPDAFEVKAIKHKDKLSKTRLNMDKPVIFEAAFDRDEIFVQVDILIKNNDATYDVVEVKSGSFLHDSYIDDVLIQYWTIVPTLNIKTYWIWLRGTEGSIQKIDLTARVSQMESRYWDLVERARRVNALKEEPEVIMGEHCSNPHECPFKAYCSKLPMNKSVSKDIKS